MAQRALTPGNAAYCSECGAETLPDAAACARCGKAFEGSIEAILCPICNSINAAKSTECVNCNARFPEPGSLTPVRPPLEPAAGSPAEEYLRRILQLSRERAKARSAPPASARRDADLPAISDASEQPGGALDESLWKLAEPFDRMLDRRKRRLEHMDALIERARDRIRSLESSTDPKDVREREELKGQIEGLLLQKEDILKLEEGLVDMEHTYRNILRMQEDELKARESSLRSRVEAFRRELESREKEFGQLKERESDILRREGEFHTLVSRLHEKERELEKREDLLREKGRLLDERLHALSQGEVDIERRRWELEQRGSSGPIGRTDTPTVTVKPPDLEMTELKGRVVQLEDQMERVMEERNRLVQETKDLTGLRDELKVVIKDLDELLGELPADKIKDFAKSEKFALYERILERLQL